MKTESSHGHFNSRPPHGGRRPVTTAIRGVLILQLTTSTRRSTFQSMYIYLTLKTSTHDLHTEVDDNSFHLFNPPNTLQLTTSTRRSTFLPCPVPQHQKYFNSRPPHGGRRSGIMVIPFHLYTSTHDLHTEVDHCRNRNGGTLKLTSTHDLHTEVDQSETNHYCADEVLQLTTSTRRSTK